MSQHYWALLRRGILAVAFWKKVARGSFTKGGQTLKNAGDRKSTARPSILASEQAPGESGYELGSLGDFLDVDLPVAHDHEPVTAADVVEAPCGKDLSPRAMSKPGVRRRVIRRGDMASARRINGARHAQIRSLFAAEGEDDPLAGSLTSSKGQMSGPIGDKAYAVEGKKVGRSDTNFTLGMAAGLVVKPIHERHPLLASIEGMLQDDGNRRDPEMASMSIARRLDELRNREARK